MVQKVQVTPSLTVCRQSGHLSLTDNEAFRVRATDVGRGGANAGFIGTQKLPFAWNGSTSICHCDLFGGEALTNGQAYIVQYTRPIYAHI